MQLPENIWSDMSGLTALVIGDVMLDKYVWGHIDRISPEAPVPVVRVEKKDDRLGGAANVALNVRALGAKALLCAAIGTDEAGDTLLSRMEARNLSTEGIIRIDGRPTTTKTRIISGHHHVARIDEETDRPLATNCQARLLQKITDLVTQADVVIFEDYDKGVISAELIPLVVALAHAEGVPVVVDPKKRNFLEYNEVDLFKPNLKELREGLNREVDKADSSSIADAIKDLRSHIGCKSALVTLSEYGVYADDGENQFQYPAHMREISDVSGAGDSVIAVAALAFAMKLPLADVAQLANLAGGLVCEHSGVVPVDVSQLKAEVLHLSK